MYVNPPTSITKYYEELFKENSEKVGFLLKLFSSRRKNFFSCLWCRITNISENSIDYHLTTCRKLQIIWTIRLATLSEIFQLETCFSNEIDYISKINNFKHSEIKLNTILEFEKSRWEVKIGSSLLPSLKINLNNFDFIKPLTKGGYGQIFLTKDKQSSNTLITKIISISEAIQRSCIDSYVIEREILLRCKCKYIVSLLYSFRSDFFIYQIMEHVNSGDLSSHLAISGAFSDLVVRAVLAQLFLALKELKDLSIVHGDIKLENILYSSELEDSHIKLADFGLAFYYKIGINYFKSALGTPEYMAPEQILNGKKGFSSDMWAVGICAYEMLTGTPPFYDESAEIILAKITQHKILKWDELNISDITKNFINRLLDSNCQTRITLEEAMDHAYFASIDWDHPPTVALTNFDKIIEERNKRFDFLQFYSKQTISTEVVCFEKGNFNQNTPIQDQLDLLKLFPIKNLNKIQI